MHPITRIGMTMVLSILYPNKEPGNFHIVSENRCFRSSQPHPKNIAYLKEHYNLASIISLRGKSYNEYDAEKASCKKYGIEFYSLSLQANNLPSNDEVKELKNIFIQAAHPILIHCKHGINRTSLGSALWLKEIHGKSEENVLNQFHQKYGYSHSYAPAMKNAIINLYSKKDC